jgi:hypothetical protein
VADYPTKALTASDNATLARQMGDEESAQWLDCISSRKDSIRDEMSRFTQMCDRFDNLYYPNQFTSGGADHWPDDPSLKIAGKVHVSVNVHPTYVDVPAALQSVVPVENMVPSTADDEARVLASHVERAYFAWKDVIGFETKSHKMATIKALYGKAACKVVWDDDMDVPQVHLVEQPRNLWLGWQSNDYTKLEWAVYAYFISPETATEEWGLEVAAREDKDDARRYVYVRYADKTWEAESTRPWLAGPQQGMLEVNDYWFREPAGAVTKGQKTKMQTHNIITVGNAVVQDRVFSEYEGALPYVPVFNTYVPGVPEGRPDLFDVEQLLREKDERISNGGTMAARLVGKQFWQLTGPEAPDRVPTGLRPKPDEVIAPGPGNRIEPISPWMPEFQLESYLARIDRELQDVSGLNDLLRGLAPAQVLSSSKAINALLANYEARITLRRQLFYQWRIDTWNLAKTLWGKKNTTLAQAFEMAGKLVVKAPSLTPRDDIEVATMALNLVNGKLWAQERGMDATGVEDPEREQETIRSERQDPALFPADVQAQAALAATMQQIQMTGMQMQQQAGPPQADTVGAEGEAMEAQAAQRGAMDEAMPGGQPMMNGEGEQAVAPPGSSAAFGGGPGFNAVNQTMLQEGEASNRIMLQQPLGPSGGQ